MALADRSVRRAGLGYIDLLQRGGRLAGPRYWLLVAINAIGYLIAGLVPLGICQGPMMCGIFYSHGKVEAGDDLEVADVFRGFDWFLPSLLVTWMQIGITLAVVVPLLFIFFPLLFYIEGSGMSQDEKGTATIALVISFYALLGIVILLLQAVFVYAYPLVVDQGMSATEAVGASWRGFRRNLGGTLKLVLGNALLWIAGSCCFCVGYFFLLPVTSGATWLAYREIIERPAPTPAPDGYEPR